MAIKIPKNQTLWLTYSKEGKPQYVVTSDLQKTKYILHKVLADFSLEKIKTSKEPCFKEVGY